IQEHIDTSLVRPKLQWSEDDEAEEIEEAATPYDDLWSWDEKKPKKQVKKSKKPFPPRSEKEILLCIEEHS
ncbi:stage V sporulation protein R, partial [Bacillus subtilis]